MLDDEFSLLHDFLTVTNKVRRISKIFPNKCLNKQQKKIIIISGTLSVIFSNMFTG